MTPIDWNPSTERLRRFGLIATAVFAYGALRAFHGVLPDADALASARGPVGIGFLVVALASLGCSLFSPPGNRPLWIFLMLATAPVSAVASTIALAVVFFGVVTPIGALRRALGADPLGRRRDSSRTSYWVSARPSRPPEDYFKLF